MGEIALRVAQIGIEAVKGTAVAATRMMHGNTMVQDDGVPPSMRTLDQNTYDEFQSWARGFEYYRWEHETGLDPEDCPEWQKLAFGPATLASTQPDSVGNPTVRLWTSAPNDSLGSASLEWNAAGDIYKSVFALCNRMEIGGSVSGDITVRLEGLCKTRTAGQTLTSLTKQARKFISGWETKFFLDPAGTTPGTTAVDLHLVEWSYRVINGTERDHMAENAANVSRINRTRRHAELECTVDMDTRALTDITNRYNATEVTASIKLGDNDLITGTFKKFVQLDIAGPWRSHEIADSAGVSRVRFVLWSVPNLTLGYGYRMRSQSLRAA